MRLSRGFRTGCLVVMPIFVCNVALAQFPLPKFPGMKKKDDSRARKKSDDGGSASAQGIPIPADSPIFQSFGLLGKQTVYHQKMTITAADPQLQQMMMQMGFGPAETITAGDTKQVSMHMMMPINGHPEDFEIRAVLANGRVAKKWVTPASTRILAEADAKLAKDLAEQEVSAAKSIARNLANGPLGLASAAMSAGAAAANAAVASRLKKEVHDFFEWTCMDAPAAAAPAQHREMPPLTDLRVVGDQTLETGTAVTAYEFFVHQDGKFQGPMQMFVAKDSGLPVRIAMNDPRAGGGMHMDYFGFNQGGDFEIPACIAEHK